MTVAATAVTIGKGLCVSSVLRRWPRQQLGLQNAGRTSDLAAALQPLPSSASEQPKVMTCCTILHCIASPSARHQAMLQQASCPDTMHERISRGHMEPSEAPERASNSCSCACLRRARATVAA